MTYTDFQSACEHASWIAAHEPRTARVIAAVSETGTRGWSVSTSPTYTDADADAVYRPRQ